MLWNPKFDKQAETKAGPLTRETLIAWLERQPENQEYDYIEADSCMAAQYLKAHGVRSFIVDGQDDLNEMLPGLGDVAVQRPWTFGAALQRARARASS